MPADTMDEDERKRVAEEFAALVNIPPAKLRHWLAGQDSRSVGMIEGGEKVTGPDQHESVGHHMGGRILDIRAKKKAELDDQDYADMRKVVGYIHRHMKQRPHGDVTETRWRKSLMNWGHDPVP